MSSKFISITIDYETWQPIPEGKTIDWDKNIFEPTSKLLDICDNEQVKITLFAEMGEYFWLKENLPETAQKFELQLKDAIKRGHDVQLHIHPNWLPELGAKFENNNWYWDSTKEFIQDYPGNLTDLIFKCKSALELIIKEVSPEYKVSCFRAGTYRVQPFKKLHDALVKNGIYCDSSVYAGGYSPERGYDFRLAYSNHQPYFANSYDPQLKAPPSENKIVEIPVFTYKPNERWFLDNNEGELFANRLLNYFNKEEKLFLSSEKYRKQKKLKTFLSNLYFKFKSFHKYLNKFIPQSLTNFISNYKPEKLVDNEYFVMIGHSKSNLNFSQISENLKTLKNNGAFEFITLSKMANIAKQELSTKVSIDADQEATSQVKREFTAIMGEDRNAEQSYYLQNLIPLDRKRVLDFGCGSGYWSDRISKLYPWMQITGIDFGEDFIKKANEKYSSDKVNFLKGDFANLEFNNESFDCVYADNTLEHSFDIDKTLSEAYRVLKYGGVLLASIPCDAYNPRMICDNHTWKTAPHEVKLRLENAGFIDININEIDTFKKLGMAPYQPSKDKMMYIKAWKRTLSASKLDRAIELMNWVYNNLSPEKPQKSNNFIEILTKGYAFCWGYSIVLGKILQKEGYKVQWVTMLAKDHPRGRGEKKIDSHEVLQVEIEDQKYIFDTMANTVIKADISEILKNPSMVKNKLNADERYTTRGYHLYDTDFWYSRVFKYAIRSEINEKLRYKRI